MQIHVLSSEGRLVSTHDLPDTSSLSLLELESLLGFSFYAARPALKSSTLISHGDFVRLVPSGLTGLLGGKVLFFALAFLFFSTTTTTILLWDFFSKSTFQFGKISINWLLNTRWKQYS